MHTGIHNDAMERLKEVCRKKGLKQEFLKIINLKESNFHIPGYDRYGYLIFDISQTTKIGGISILRYKGKEAPILIMGIDWLNNYIVCEKFPYASIANSSIEIYGRCIFACSDSNNLIAM